MEKFHRKHAEISITSDSVIKGPRLQVDSESGLIMRKWVNRDSAHLGPSDGERVNLLVLLQVSLPGAKPQIPDIPGS